MLYCIRAGDKTGVNTLIQRGNSMDKKKIIDKINTLRKEKNAIILAHNYQIPEVQDIADIVGDSLALSRAAAKTNCEMIVFCGVHFMAESAKILSPDKKVLLPVYDAGCPMADMITAEELRSYKSKHSDTKIVCYVNSSAEVKAESDICCTSSNALKIVQSIDADKVLFVPDKNLGGYIRDRVKDKTVDLWPGFCITHQRAVAQDVLSAKDAHPDAEVLVHPECSSKIVDLAHFVGSTSQIIEYANKSESKSFLIGTEMGVLHKLRQDNPDKNFYMISQSLVCYNIKKTSLEDVLSALQDEKHQITVDENIRIRALKSLDDMLKLS